MYTAEQLLLILIQVADLASDDDLSIGMLWRSWDGKHHTSDEVLNRFLVTNHIVTSSSIGFLESPLTEPRWPYDTLS